MTHRATRWRHFDLPERLGSFGFIRGSDKIVAAFESGFAHYHPESANSNGCHARDTKPATSDSMTGGSTGRAASGRDRWWRARVTRRANFIASMAVT